MTDTETLNEQLFCTMFSIMPNVPVGNRAANHHLSSFKDRQKTRLRSKVGEGGWLKKTIQLINSSHTIRSCSITSLSYWTNSCLQGSPGPRLATIPHPSNIRVLPQPGEPQKCTQLPIPIKQQLGLCLTDLLVHVLAVPCTPPLGGNPQVLTMLRSLGSLHAPPCPRQQLSNYGQGTGREYF